MGADAARLRKQRAETDAEGDALSNARKSAGLVLGVVSAAAVALATLTPSGQLAVADVRCIVCGDFGGGDFILNVALFVPAGASLALAGMRLTRALVWLVSATLAIETLQLVVISGRDASVGDLLANGAGGALGFLLGSHLETLARPSSTQAVRLLLAAASLWLTVQTISSYALIPIASPETHYGLLGRRVRGSPPFTGRILGLTVDGRGIPDGQLADQGWVRRAMLGQDGAGKVEIAFLPGTRYDVVSPVARIGDEHGADVLFIGALRSDLVFGVRGGASALRLRPARFRLEGVLAGARPTDTIRAGVHYSPPHATLVAFQPPHPPRTIPLTPAQGWRLLLPWQSYTRGSTTDALVDAAWLFMLLLPSGYWAAFAWDRGGRVIALGVAGAVAAGLMIGPLWFGLSLPHWHELLAAVAGVSAGATTTVLAHATRRQRHHGADP